MLIFVLRLCVFKLGAHTGGRTDKQTDGRTDGWAIGVLQPIRVATHCSGKCLQHGAAHFVD